MLTSIPTEIWNRIANETNLKTEWARRTFRMSEEEMERLEEKEADELEQRYPRLVVRGFQDMRPLLLEMKAIQTWLKKNPDFRNALPEVNSLDEAVMMASLDWMYNETEKKQLKELLTQAMKTA